MPEPSNSKPLYQYIFDLLDYGDQLIGLIEADGLDRGNYFMTLVYIEDILDKYGRGLVMQSATSDGKDGSEMMHLATGRMDQLRHSLRLLSQTYDFDEILKSRGEEMLRNWGKPA